jgi:hypothetical protein
MEWSTPTVRLSIRIKKVNTEPTLHDHRTPTPKQKLKKVSFGSVDIFKFMVELESPIMCRTPSIPKTLKNKQRRRFSI